MKALAAFFASVALLSIYRYKLLPPIQSTLAMRACISLYYTIALNYLGSEGGDLILLNLKGYAVLIFSISEVGVNFAHHMDAVEVLPPDQAQFVAMVLQMGGARFPSTND